MKNTFFKKAIAIGVVLMMALSTSTGVLAATKISSKTNQTTSESNKTSSSKSKSTDEDDEEKNEDNEKETSSKVKSNKSAKDDEASDTEESSTEGKTVKAKDPKATTTPKSTKEVDDVEETQPKQTIVRDGANYTTKGGSFGWFLLGLILNSIISFGLCLRFYRMGKRDNHLSAEIRALRKDISAKFASNVGGFTEFETRVKNANPSYAKSDSNIKTEETVQDDDKINEIYKKWSSQIPTEETPVEPLDPATAPPTVARETSPEPEFDPSEETREEAINRFASTLNIHEKTPPRIQKEEKESVKDKLFKAFDTIIPKE